MEEQDTTLLLAARQICEDRCRELLSNDDIDFAVTWGMACSSLEMALAAELERDVRR